MNKNTIYLLFVGVGVVVIVILALMFAWTRPATAPHNNNPPPPPSANQEGITVDLPKPGDTVTSPLKITGRVNGNGWTGFEGQVGIVKLFDAQDKELGMAILTASTDWMQLPTQFQTQLFFDYSGTGEGKLVFYNENASGEPGRNKTLTVPVKLTTSSASKTKVRVYFSNDKTDPAYICEKVFPVEREIAKTQAIARAALESLFSGPTSAEQTAGFMTNINRGVKIQSLTVENGTAKVDLSSELNNNVAGSCRVLAIRSQITQTLKQFSTVQNVVISVNGDSTTILQP